VTIISCASQPRTAVVWPWFLQGKICNTFLILPHVDIVGTIRQCMCPRTTIDLACRLVKETMPNKPSTASSTSKAHFQIITAITPGMAVHSGIVNAAACDRLHWSDIATNTQA